MNDFFLQQSPITFSSKNHEGMASFLSSQKKQFSTAIIISDHQVFTLFGESIMQIIKDSGVPLTEPFLFPAGEPYKTLSTTESCWTHMQTQGVDRKSLVIALGGGVVTDLAGFAAATYMRGISHICIPTTLMGMVDAAIGGKTAVNLPIGKNLIGAFHHPILIDISTSYLSKLPDREFYSGLAEVIKYGVITKKDLFDFLEKNMEVILKKEVNFLEQIIRTSCEIKQNIVELDEKETGQREILNFGHTFAHAIEAMTHYKTYLHGEAVAIGMCCAAYLSNELGLLNLQVVHKLIELCERAGLPTQLPISTNLDELIYLMKNDKKSIAKKINLILLREIGKVEKFLNADTTMIKKALLKVQSQGSLEYINRSSHQRNY